LPKADLKYLGTNGGFVRIADLGTDRSERQLRADCVEKLVVFGPLMLVITLISFGCS